MKIKIIIAIAAIVGLSLFGAPAALAEAMKCSGEQKICISVCQKSPRDLIADCIANCRARLNYCRQTGCWDNGTNRYCNLTRQ